MSGDAAALAETHSAVVVFIGDCAYKVKKPVDLGFLDFSTRGAREAVCHRGGDAGGNADVSRAGARAAAEALAAPRAAVS